MAQPRRSNGLRDGLIEFGAVSALALTSLVIGIAIITVVSERPGEAVEALLAGAFANPFQFGTMLARSVPYLMTGLAVAVAFRASVFNIGAEGQLYVGALAGTYAALSFTGLPRLVHVPLVLVVAAAAGGIYGALPGYFKAAYKADEIVITLMMNFVAILGVSYFVAGPLRDPGSGGFPQSAVVPESARLLRFMPPARVHIGFFVALGLAVAVWVLLRRTTIGYELRMSGLNPEFARYGGIAPERAIVISMAISGALAGIAGAMQVIGDILRLVNGFSGGYGFIGILIALLARNKPLLVVPAALFYAYLVTGAQVMEDTTDVPREMVVVIQAILFLLITSQALFLWVRRRGRRPSAASRGAETTEAEVTR